MSRGQDIPIFRQAQTQIDVDTHTSRPAGAQSTPGDRQTVCSASQFGEKGAGVHSVGFEIELSGGKIENHMETH